MRAARSPVLHMPVHIRDYAPSRVQKKKDKIILLVIKKELYLYII